MRFHLFARHLQDPHSSPKLQKLQEIVRGSLVDFLVRSYQSIVGWMFPLRYGRLGTFDLVPQWFSVGLQSDFSGKERLSPCASDMLAVPFAVVSFGAIILLVSRHRCICNTLMEIKSTSETGNRLVCLLGVWLVDEPLVNTVVFFLDLPIFP